VPAIALNVPLACPLRALGVRSEYIIRFDMQSYQCIRCHMRHVMWRVGACPGARQVSRAVDGRVTGGKPSAVVDQKALRFLRKNIPRLAKLMTRHTNVSPDHP
jgi:hypothetical protein